MGQDVAHGQWSVTEASQSSTWRELRAVFEVLRAYALKLQGHLVKWFTDNQNVARIVRVGNKKLHLQDGAMAIFQTCLQHAIKLEMEWIPCDLNQKTDYISRLVDWDN